MPTNNIIKPSFKSSVQKYFTAISLFAGAGGMDMGFSNQGFNIIWANDIDNDACLTHQSWSKSTVIHSDIGKIDFKDIPRSDVILGGFPCQGFSHAGPRRIDDKRNYLYRYFVKLVECKQPLAFVAENVKGILTLGNGYILEAIISEFASKGYRVLPILVNAADYNVPQDRFRVFLIGLRKDKRFSFRPPKPSEQRISIADALANIPAPKKEDICYDSYSPRYMSRNRKRNWNEVSFTIPATARQIPLHPSSPDMIKIDSEHWKFGHGHSRRFSWQEAAAIQTFPPGMEFYGSLASKYNQIGNAVPVKLAEAISKSLFDTLMQAANDKDEQTQFASVGI